jgi:murein DD-endopeptidase MepM/ murein hydrolase activator NlpD
MLSSLKQNASECRVWFADQVSRLRRGERVLLKTLLQASLALWVVSAGVSFALVNLGPDASRLTQKTMRLELKWDQLEALSPHEDALPPLANSPQTVFEGTPSEDTLSPHAEPNTRTDAKDGSWSPSNGFYRTDWSRTNDSAQSLLARLDVNDPQAREFIAAHPLVRSNLLGKSQRLVSVSTNSRRALSEMVVRWAHDSDRSFSRLVIQRSSAGFSAKLESAPLKVSTQIAAATIQSSLYQATDVAHIPDSLANQMVEIFSGDIDFHRSLRKGDHFTLLYETLTADGETLKTARVLSAEFVNRGHPYRAIWFNSGEPQTSGYYTMEGMNLKRMYLAAPLAFSRITSGFKMRFHPILNEWKAHRGVDYAAPVGTPIRTVANGVVEFAGVQNGYGSVVAIKHPQGSTTLYAHLSRIDVRKGQSVEQGERIGAVGQTGWATGPHLHFEFRLNGQYQDPELMARQNAPVPLATALRPAFERQALQAREVLLNASGLESVDID